MIVAGMRHCLLPMQGVVKGSQGAGKVDESLDRSNVEMPAAVPEPAKPPPGRAPQRKGKGKGKGRR